jgi:hypothetical protein
MRTQSLLRISSITALLFGIGHTIGYPWVGDVTTEQFSQISAVKSVRAVTQGFLRSYWDFHIGFGITISLLFLVQAIIFWQLGSFGQSEPKSARFVAAVFGAFYIACTVVDFIFFFWAPIICSTVLSVCLVTASMRAWRAVGRGNMTG